MAIFLKNCILALQADEVTALFAWAVGDKMDQIKFRPLQHFDLPMSYAMLARLDLLCSHHLKLV